MLETIQSIIHQNDLCVLATVGNGGPHTSLMAYSCSSDCSEIYLVTSTKTQKYRNICHSPTVSLMVDTRSENDRSRVHALSISGLAAEIEDCQVRENVRHQMLARHPHLADLIQQPDVSWLCVRVHNFQLLVGVHDSFHVDLTQDSKN